MPDAHDELRVLHVLAPARSGGLESIVVQLTAGLRARGNKVHVAVVLAPGTESGHPVVTSLEENDIPTTVLVLGTRDYLAERRAVRALLGALDVQVLHTHGYRADTVLGDVARRDRRRHVTTLHGFVGGSARARAYEWMQIQSARFASGVIAVSAPIAHRLKQHDIIRNVRIIPNAITPPVAPFGRDEARRELGLPADLPLIGWIGRFSHEKGPDVFLDAISKTGGHIHAVMIGEGPELESVKERARHLGLEHRLSFTGLVSSASRYVQALDALALTSRTEGTPVTLLECMWSAVPIVATSVGGVPDLLTDADALLCPSSDVGALAAAIESTISNPSEAADRAKSALLRVGARYSLAGWLEAHEDFYRTIVGR